MQSNTVILQSLARTTTQTNTLATGDGKGVVCVLSMTVVGTGSVTLSINGYDPISGATWLLLAGAAVVTNSTNVYKVYPGLTASANAVANDVIPSVLQFVVTANNANTATYSLSANIIG